MVIQAKWSGRRQRPLGMSDMIKPGAMPGTMVTDPDAPAPTIAAIRYNGDGIEECAACEVGDIGSLLGGDMTLWVNVTGLGDAEVIRRIGDAFNLHRLELEDIANVMQRPKTEEYEDHVHIVARMIVPNRGVETEQVSMFLGKGFVLTFQERVGDCFAPVRERIRHGRGRIRMLGPDYLAYALIDSMIDSYYPLLEDCGEEVDRLEDGIIDRPDIEQMHRLHDVKRDLLMLRRAVWPMREMVNSLIRDESPFVTDGTRVYLRDCYDHAIQLMDVIETYREISSSLIDAYLSSMSARLNEIMKVLTIIATIFIPLGFVASVYGMNFDPHVSPWNMPELRYPYGYPLALLGMALIAGGLLAYFWRRGWIGRGRRRKSRP